MIRLGSWVSSEKNGANEEQLVIPGILSEKSSAKSGIAVAFCFPKNVHMKPILKPKTFNQFSTSNFTITLLNCFVLKSLCSKTKQLRSVLVKLLVLNKCLNGSGLNYGKPRGFSGFSILVLLLDYA